jgi:hypothetical protein
MSISSWFPWKPARQDKGRSRSPYSPQAGRGTRLVCEQLEDRTVPTKWTAARVSDLIHDINAANRHGGSNTITLVAGKTFTLAAVDNTTDGPTGLPVIAANDNLTIQGNGDTIERAPGTPDFRLFDVAVGASLTLANATLQGGSAVARGGIPAQGGAIFSQGALTLTGVTVTHNVANGGGTIWTAGPSAYGGGLYVASGSATLDNVTLSFNTAQGGLGGSNNGIAGRGSNAYGGGLYVAAGTLALTSVTLGSNSAVGGGGGTGYFDGGPGGDGYGGGLCVGGGTVTLRSVTTTGNSAQGGPGGPPGSFGGSGPAGLGEGGGLYNFYPATSLYLDAFTLANTTGNKPDNIYGSYTLI